jgi:hypothetical protein
MVFQSLRCLGNEAVTETTVTQLRIRLSPAKRCRLARDAHHITDWIAEVVRRVVAEPSAPLDAARR